MIGPKKVGSLELFMHRFRLRGPERELREAGKRLDSYSRELTRMATAHGMVMNAYIHKEGLDGLIEAKSDDKFLIEGCHLSLYESFSGWGPVNERFFAMLGSGAVEEAQMKELNDMLQEYSSTREAVDRKYEGVVGKYTMAHDFLLERTLVEDPFGQKLDHLVELHMTHPSLRHARTMLTDLRSGESDYEISKVTRRKLLSSRHRKELREESKSHTVYIVHSPSGLFPDEAVFGYVGRMLMQRYSTQNAKLPELVTQVTVKVPSQYAKVAQTLRDAFSKLGQDMPDDRWKY